jgi:hypothetical protein
MAQMAEHLLSKCKTLSSNKKVKMDITPQTGLKARTQSRLITEIRNFQAFNHSGLFYLTLSPAYEFLPMPASSSQCESILAGSFSPCPLISQTLIFPPFGSPSSPSLPHSWERWSLSAKSDFFFFFSFLL